MKIDTNNSITISRKEFEDVLFSPPCLAFWCESWSSEPWRCSIIDTKALVEQLFNRSSGERDIDLFNADMKRQDEENES